MPQNQTKLEHLTMFIGRRLGSFKNLVNKMFTNQIFNLYKEDLALNNLQWLICHQTKPNQTKSRLIYTYKQDLALNSPQSLISKAWTAIDRLSII